MRHRILLAASFAYLAIANIIWIARDTRPPFWDMAAHLDETLKVFNAFANTGLRAFVAIPAEHLTGYYPPLYHLLIATSWAFFGKSIDVARTTNLVAVAVLMLATYGLGCSVLEPFTAAIAAVLVSFYPFLLWLSRETIIDYWLAAIVALAMWVLLRTREFSNRGWSVVFGVTAGLGMLMKWTFPLFIVLPALWFARKNWKNAAISAAIAAVISAWWYVPGIPALAQFLSINNAGAVFEGDPERFSWQAVVFYVRVLEGYQLFLPLFVAFVAGIVVLRKRIDSRWIPILLWLVGGWLGLMLFRNKDPRYSAPLLAAIALITAPLFERRRVLTAALLGFLLVQHYIVSFGVRRIPESVVVMQGVGGELSWNWNLYTQSYFGLWGRPAREDWKIQHVLETVAGGKTQEVRLGMAPDIPRFDSQAFQFYVDLLHLPVRLKRVSVFDEPAILGNDYLLISDNRGPHPAAFEPDPRVNAYVTGHPEEFQVVERFPLPNGDAIGLYKVN